MCPAESENLLSAAFKISVKSLGRPGAFDAVTATKNLRLTTGSSLPFTQKGARPPGAFLLIKRGEK
jgi:hypothetical protein